MGFERTEPIAMLRWPQNRRPSRSSDLCQLSSISVSGTSVSAFSSAGADGEHRSCCPDSTVFWFGKMIVRKVCCPGRRFLLAETAEFQPGGQNARPRMFYLVPGPGCGHAKYTSALACPTTRYRRIRWSCLFTASGGVLGAVHYVPFFASDPYFIV